MKQLFYEGELVTALPNDKYAKTNNGWTGRVINCGDDISNFFEVVAKDRFGYVRPSRSWDVLKRFFIPYSSNMETSAFENFYICGGDDE